MQLINIKHGGRVPPAAQKKALQMMREAEVDFNPQDKEAAIKWVIDQNPEEFKDLVK